MMTTRLAVMLLVTTTFGMESPRSPFNRDEPGASPHVRPPIDFGGPMALVDDDARDQEAILEAIRQQQAEIGGDDDLQAALRASRMEPHQGAPQGDDDELERAIAASLEQQQGFQAPPEPDLEAAISRASGLEHAARQIDEAISRAADPEQDTTFADALAFLQALGGDLPPEQVEAKEERIRELIADAAQADGSGAPSARPDQPEEPTVLGMPVSSLSPRARPASVIATVEEPVPPPTAVDAEALKKLEDRLAAALNAPFVRDANVAAIRAEIAALKNQQ